jgi:hypothetical protein
MYAFFCIFSNCSVIAKNMHEESKDFLFTAFQWYLKPLNWYRMAGQQTELHAKSSLQKPTNTIPSKINARSITWFRSQAQVSPTRIYITVKK